MDHGGSHAPEANGVAAASSAPGNDVLKQAGAQRVSDRMNDLPDEIVHITEGFVPLSRLFSRLAQSTHNQLQAKIIEMAEKPLPASAVNGSGSGANAPDDLSNENVRKKETLLKFAQDMHGKWVKALVIAEWSRKAPMVSKLIDLKWHVDQQRMLYDLMLDQIVNVKRDLSYAHMPSPDLKTALGVLSTGSAPWMPDMYYIEPEPLDVNEQLKWMSDLDTLLSLRLNLDEFDKIPPQFRNYEIDSGRVTFKVDGEFEVDLTIADEDFEKQFWFIDFRFAFKPAAATIPETLRGYLEGCVNEALFKDGLAGCYQFLHEFVLTCKINEIKRQALRLSRSSWTGTLMVEPLHRSLAIQYWTSRTPPTTPKSWVLISVNSGRPATAKPTASTAATSSATLDASQAHTTSRLEIKWYRDNKEVTTSGDGASPPLAFDTDNLSAETLLRTVVGRHTIHILGGIYDRLLTTPRFKNADRRLRLDVSEDGDPAKTRLTAEVARSTNVALLMEPKTGVLAIKPNSKFTYHQEQKLNSGADHIEGGFFCLEDVRCAFLEDEIVRRSGPAGWSASRAVLRDEELRSIVKVRDWTRTIWLQRKGWPENWQLVVILGLGGDEWWLMETAPSLNITPWHRFQLRLPLPNGAPDLTEAFWNRLTIFTTAMMSHCINMAVLRQNRTKHRLSDVSDWPTTTLKLPAIDISLSAMFPSMAYEENSLSTIPGDSADELSAGNDGSRRGKNRGGLLALVPREPWAKNNITLRLKTVQAPAWQSTAATTQTEEQQQQQQQLVCVSEAVIKVRKPAKLAALKGRVDDSVHYDERKGEFHLTMRHPVGESTLEALKTRIVAVDRFVCFLEALGRNKDTIESEEVSLGHVSFFYQAKKEASQPAGEDAVVKSETQDPEAKQHQRWRVALDLSRPEVGVELDEGNPHLCAADVLRRMVNMDGGIGTLMAWLPSSLPTLAAVDAVETAWQGIQADAAGSVEVIVKTTDWMHVRYTVAATTTSDNGDASTPVSRHLVLDGRVKMRHGEAWWIFARSNQPPGHALAQHHHPDAFDKALKPIFDGRGPGWQGLANGATGRLGAGSAALIAEMDAAVRALVGQLDGDTSFEDKAKAATALQQRFQQQQQQQHSQQQQPPQQQGRQAQRPMSMTMPPRPGMSAQAQAQWNQRAQQAAAAVAAAKSGKGPDQAIEIG